jgi:hypothetical protein
VRYAGAKAEAEMLGERVQFQQIDALLILEFPTGRFESFQPAGGSQLAPYLGVEKAAA